MRDKAAVSEPAAFPAKRERVFVALDIPGDAAANLGKLIASAKARQPFPGLRWVSIENAHITLKFIGETPAEDVAKIRAALAGVSAAGPIQMKIAGLGFFPSEQRPLTFWAGVLAGSELQALAGAIETALGPLGIVRERRRFRPHVTLGRMKPDKLSASGMAYLRALAAASSAEFGRGAARAFHLYRSVLKSTEAEYTRLETFTLAGE